MDIHVHRDFLRGIERIAPTLAVVHCDLSRGFPIVVEKGKREQAILAHYRALETLLGEIPLCFPAFSYSFFTQRRFDVQHTASEIGILPEYFRKNLATWRTKDPVFSYSGNRPHGYIDPAAPGVVLDPWGDASFYQHLYDNNALFFHYGSGIEHSTIIHFVERKLGIVPYRYDKLFAGLVCDETGAFNITYRFHARPKGMHMAYDWDRLARDLAAAGIFHIFEQGHTVLSYMRVREMTDFILSKLRADPFYLLDAKTREWVIPAIDRLQRHFVLTDFE